MDDPREVLTIAEYEHYSIEEARLVFAQRQNIPDTAFAGPHRTYPSNDAGNVRTSLDKLSKYGKGLPKSVVVAIYRHLLRRAKQLNVKHDQGKFGWLIGDQTVEEVFEKMDEKEERPVSRSDFDWLERRLKKLERTSRILVALLVEKKLIGVTLQKAIEESKQTGGTTFEWLDNEINIYLENLTIEEALWIQKAIGKKGALRKQLGIKEDETIPMSILVKIKNAETGTTVSFRGKKITVTTQLKRRAILAIRLSQMKKS